jgi:hypothetical protein
MLTRSKRLALAAIAWLVAAGQAQCITFGERDGDDHPYVGTLLFVQSGEGFFSCTGTLLNPTVMLTAGHCVEGNGELNNLTYVRFEEDAFKDIDAYPTLQDWLDAEWILASQVIAHPQYDDYAQFPDTFDVGLVILSQPVSLGTYGALPPAGLLNAVAAQKGNRYNWWTAVGYGAQGIIQPFAMDDFARYQTQARLIELSSRDNGPGSSAKFSNNPGKGQGGTCFGDSGGPIFYQDSNVIGAIVSFGITPCIGVDYQFRIDTPTALDFIRPFLP